MTTSFSCDETPTPTRLIQNFDAAGFFQDLHQDNPFEETFRNAAVNNDISNLLKNPLPKTQTEETLNTPRVLPPTKTNNYPIFPDEDDTVSDFLEPILPEIQYVDCLKNQINAEESTEIEIIEECEPDSSAENLPYLSTLNNANRENEKSIIDHSPHNKVSIVKDFLFDSNSLQTMNGNIGGKLVTESTKPTVNVINDRKSMQNESNKSTTNLTTSIITNSANVGAFFKLQNVQKSINSTGNVVYNLVNSGASLPKVIDGKNIIIIPSKPVQNGVRLPITKLMPKETAVIEPRVFSVKQKLKTMLSNGSNSSQRLSNVENFNNSDDVMVVSDSGETKDTGGLSSPEDDKREHSRERNRMAQKRCRLKKKKWIMQLKNETEVVVAKNHKLQSEILSLKAEIAHLKTLLLAHRNCSVTRAMYKADLNAILNNDVSELVEDIEIPAADDLEDTSTNGSQITINNQFTSNQIHRHLHVHVPLWSNGTDSELSLAPSVEQDVQPSSLLRQLSTLHTQFDRSKTLMCDSKVVPFKPLDRPLNKCYQKGVVLSDSKVLTTRNTQDKSETTTTAQAVK